MARTTLLAVAGMLLAAGCGGGGTAGPECALNDDCVTGYLCVAERCQAVEPVQIVTSSLPNATIGSSYRTVLEAQGGQEPYTWRLMEKPGWMTVDADTGVVSGEPTTAATGVVVKVRVEDATSGRDSSDEKTFTIDVVACADGETAACTVEQDGKCMVGRQTCSNGQFGPCSNLDFSIDFESCGPGCLPCEPARADACRQGICACGDGSACTAPDICCDGRCRDGSNDGNCGACGLTCSEGMQNTVNPRCQDGQCVSDGCLPAWLDCDGDTQNGCETAASTSDCGSCGADCSAVEHVTEVTCEVGSDGSSCGYVGDGSVGLGCELGWLDCDGDRSNGCEMQVDQQNCGACGLVCTAQCLVHQDGDRYYCGCTADTDCGSDGLCCDGECALASDPRHCGSCANDCTTQVQHAPATCSAGQCGHGQCEAGWLDCDNDAANGCELPMDDMNCGSCGFACGSQAACDTQSGTCACVDEYQNCDSLWDNGCESHSLTDVSHCGDCGTDCTQQLENVQDPACQAGTCDYGTCLALYLDCDGNRLNGCEQAMDDDNCGSCGFNCGQHAGCDSGSCACLTNWGNCYGDWADGCETDLQTTVSDCGDCGNDCATLPNVDQVGCAGGACQIASCQTRYGNCNSQVDDGCETDLWQTGACGTDCGNRVDCNTEVQNAVNPYCFQGSCNYQQCSWCQVGQFQTPCYGDCDGNRSNGCEDNLWDVSNCRQDCNDTGIDCNSAVVNVQTVLCHGECTYSDCQPGYSDCDTNRANGCEIHTAGDVTNCGGCGYDCADHVDNAGGLYCSNSLCNYQSCNTYYLDCNGNRQDGCETYRLATSTCGTNCGNLVDCNQRVQNASGIRCDATGTCNYTDCIGLFDDCDGNRSNGCETSVAADPNNCGSCGNRCNSGWICIQGRCEYPG